MGQRAGAARQVRAREAERQRARVAANKRLTAGRSAATNFLWWGQLSAPISQATPSHHHCHPHCSPRDGGLFSALGHQPHFTHGHNGRGLQKIKSFQSPNKGETNNRNTIVAQSTSLSFLFVHILQMRHARSVLYSSSDSSSDSSTSIASATVTSNPGS